MERVLSVQRESQTPSAYYTAQHYGTPTYRRYYIGCVPIYNCHRPRDGTPKKEQSQRVRQYASGSERHWCPCMRRKKSCHF
jgi:hypothetical protein